MTIYDRIKNLAEQQKLSIRSLEEKLGYGNGTIRRWEKQVPGVDKVQKVADYFNVSTDYLLGRDSNSTDPLDLLSKGKFRRKDYTTKQQEELREELSNYLEFRAKLLNKKDKGS